MGPHDGDDYQEEEKGVSLYGPMTSSVVFRFHGHCKGKIAGMTKPRPARKGCRSYLRHSAKGLLDE